MKNKLICGALLMTLVATLSPSASAQEKKLSKREARNKEIKELEEMLSKVESAMKKIKPLLNPKFELAQYDVRQLLYRPDDRIAPKLSIPSASVGYRTNKGKAVGGTLNFGDDDESYENALLDPDKLLEILRGLTDEDAWEDPASIEVSGGFVICYQSKLVLERIESTLESLRKTASRSIQMEVGFYSLPPELKKSLEQSALMNKGLLSKKMLTVLDQAINSKKAEVLGNAMLTALSNQRVYLHQGFEQSYVATIERSSGGTGMAVATISDPVVEVLRTGLALDMKGTVIDRGGKRQVAMDVRFLQSIGQEMREIKTPFGSIDMPRVTTNFVRTSARVPDGHGMLIFTQKKRGGEQSDSKGKGLTIIARPRILPSR